MMLKAQLVELVLKKGDGWVLFPRQEWNTKNSCFKNDLYFRKFSFTSVIEIISKFTKDQERTFEENEDVL